MKLSDLFQSLWPHTDDYARYLPAEEPDEDVIGVCRAAPVDQGGNNFEKRAYALTDKALVVVAVMGTRSARRYLTDAEVTITSYPLAHLAYVERKHTFAYSQEFPLINKTRTAVVFHFTAASGIPPISVQQMDEHPQSEYLPFFRLAMRLPYVETTGTTAP